MVLWHAADGRWRLHDLVREVAQVPLNGQNAPLYQWGADDAPG